MHKILLLAWPGPISSPFRGLGGIKEVGFMPFMNEGRPDLFDPHETKTLYL